MSRCRLLLLALTLWSFACTRTKTEEGKHEPADETIARGTAASSSTTATPPSIAAKAKPKTKTKQYPAPANVAKAPPEAKVSASGLATIVLRKGTGKHSPIPRDHVKLHFIGWTADGTTFDSSHSKGNPATFGVRLVIRGWTEGLQMMVVGEKRRFWIPAELAYGNKARRPGAPAGQLTFDIELIGLMRHASPPEPPKELKHPARDAKRLAGGLAYKRLKVGTGTAHPMPGDRIKINYTGWSKEGKMFDSSVITGKPATFSLSRSIEGWTNGIQKMVIGESALLWVPSAMAYGDKPRRPQHPAGDLIYQIELVEIIKSKRGQPKPSAPESKSSDSP